MRIKSALEIALERTETVEGDPEKIRISELVKTGKRLMGTFLLNPEKTIEELGKGYAAIAEKDKPVIDRNMTETLMANISLPQDDLYVQQLGRLKQAAEFLAGEGTDLAPLFSQLDQLFQQYLQSRDQLLEMARQQYEPQLRQKEAQLAQQTGRQVTLQPEQDPEFIKFLESNYKHLENSYQEGLSNVKEQLSQVLAG